MTTENPRILAGFIETAPDAMIVVRSDGSILEANQRAEAMFGVDAGALSGRSVEDLLPEHLADRHREHRKGFLEDPTPRPMGTGQDLVARRPDGTEFPVDVSLGVVEVDGETLVAVAVRDVTEQADAQRALAASAFIVDSSQDAIYSLDASGAVTTWNRAAELLTGRRAEEMLGVVTDRPLHLVPSAGEAGLIERARSGELIQRHHVELLRIDGTAVPISLTMAAIRDTRGRVVGTSGIARDITEEVTAQETLADVQQLLDTTQRLAQIGLWAHDPRSGEVQWSAGMFEIAEVSPFDFDGTLDALLGIVADEDRSMVAEALADAIEHKEPLHIEFPIVVPDGSRRWLMCRAEMRLSKDGSVAEVRGICQDLTERQQLLDKLRETDRMKDEFLGVVSHELRTPLTSIVGFGGLLRDMVEGEQKTWADVLVRNAEEMGGMIERILDFSRVSDGRLHLVVEPIAVEDVIAEIEPLISAPLKEHQLVVEAQPSLAMLVDRHAVRRIIVNLLTNAAKFSPPGSSIELRIEAQGSDIEIRVRDEGAGIPAEEHDRVFERFHQVPSNMVASKRGVGVGLAIVKGYVEAMGGTVGVDSSVGNGSTFIVRVPRAHT